MFELPPAPRISGPALRALVKATSSGPVKRVLLQVVKKDLGMDALDGLDPSVRMPIPLDVHPLRARREHIRTDDKLGPLPTRKATPGTSAFVQGYQAGHFTPTEIVDRVFKTCSMLAEQRPSLGPLHVPDESNARRDAERSTERYARGAPLGPLDGVPIAIKEEVSVKGLRTMLGTSWMETTAAEHDAEVVKRLRAEGAIILGHAPMTELGMSPLGFNPHRAMPHNPHDPGRAPGGSSTGCAVGVACGAFPLSVAGDGGGSIRIPSSLNGVFGIKPTFGLVSRTGDPFGGTVAHLGPIGVSTADLAAMLDLVCGVDAEDSLTHVTPASVHRGSFSVALGRGVQGLRIGVCEAELDAADGEVAHRCREALETLHKEGAILVPVRPRLAKYATAVGYLTIGLEFLASLRTNTAAQAAQYGPDTALLSAVLSEMEPDRYLDAQRIRASIRHETREILKTVDVMALPSCATTAPVITDAQLREGLLDPPALDAMCRFTFWSNLTGLPAGSVPVGRDKNDLPVGLQFIADAWDDATVLQVMAHLERTECATFIRPKPYRNILS